MNGVDRAVSPQSLRSRYKNFSVQQGSLCTIFFPQTQLYIPSGYKDMDCTTSCSLSMEQPNRGAIEAPLNACCMNLGSKSYALATQNQTVCGRKLSATDCKKHKSSHSCEENLVVALKHTKIQHTKSEEYQTINFPQMYISIQLSPWWGNSRELRKMKLVSERIGLMEARGEKLGGDGGWRR